MEKISRIKAIREFFSSNGGRKVGMGELKVLTDDEKQELGELCAQELGKELVDLPPKDS